MKQPKRILSLVLALVLVAACLPTGVHATVIASGRCGDDLTWVLEGNDLIISGTGAMDDYTSTNPAPWQEYAGGLMTITLEDGVTTIGNFAFAGLTCLLEVSVPQSVTKVGKGILQDSSGRIIFWGNAPTFDGEAFLGFDRTCNYFRHWDTAVLKLYGGNPIWNQGELYLFPDNQQLYALNEPIVVENLKFGAMLGEFYFYQYDPTTVTIGAYDNSTVGQKTVKVTADGWTFDYVYQVTDGQSHLQEITVEFDRIQTYFSGAVTPEIQVKDNGQVIGNEFYRKSFSNNTQIGPDASVTITGLGRYEGFEETYSFAIVKGDLKDAVVEVDDASFYGIPMEPEVRVYLKDQPLTRDQDYRVIYENNVNIGTGTVRVVGINGYQGTATQTFQIDRKETDMYLQGAYNGSQLDGVFTDDYAYQEGLMSPGVLNAHIDSIYPHVAVYQLFRMDGEDAVLVTEYETEYAIWTYTGFTYDFSDIYDSKNPDGGEIYMLVYTWVDSNYDVFTGVNVMYISAKVEQATEMAIVCVEQDDDFRREYLSVEGVDGVLGEVTWSSSDESVATVSNGVVTFAKAGTATITAKSGKLTATWTVETQSQELAYAVILEQDDHVYYNGELLQKGIDYTSTVTTRDGVRTVTVTGRGLFTGQILRQFDTKGRALDHTHTFTDGKDTNCGGCDFVRELSQPSNDHKGDLDGNGQINEDDAIYLLQYVLLPEFFPVDQDVDFDGNGKVNEDDAIYLLQHVLLPDFFPL